MATDSATEVILEFQAVMARWLELQASVMRAAQQRATGPAPAPIPAVPVRGVRVAPQALALVPAPAVAPITLAPTAPAPLAPFRYGLGVRPCPLGPSRGVLAKDHAVVIVDDGRGIGAGVAERLRDAGMRVALVQSAGASDPSSGAFACALETLEDAEGLARSIHESCGPVAALIHLAPLAAGPSFHTLDSAAWWSQLSRETRALFLLARAFGAPLQQAARQGGAVLLAATSMGGGFGAAFASRAIQPSHGGVAGFLKCVAIEWPEVRVRAIDFDDADAPGRIAEHLVDELWAVEAQSEIGYRDGRRLQIEVEAVPARLDDAFEVPSDGVILATGGARGITAEVCLDLAQRYQPTFVLVGQSPLPPSHEAADTAGLTAAVDVRRALTDRLRATDGRVTPAIVERAFRTLMKEREIRETISRLSAACARTHYVQLDVQDDAALGRLVDEVYETYGRIDGVIHGAGIIEDKLVRDKPVESFDRVLRTKTLSALTLCRHLRPASLKFMVFFSSVAGRFGNRGQADYAAANEVVGKLAVLLQQSWPARVCSIAWAPWDRSGMVSPELKREFERRGVGLLPPAMGRLALWHEIQQASSAPAEVVVAGQGAPEPDPVAARPMPLLVGATRVSAADGIRFERTLNPSSDRYLNDHRLDGRAVLPLAFAAEHMAEAAQAVWPDLRVVEIRDLQMYKGITVDAAPVPIAMVVRARRGRAEAGSVEADVELTTPSARPPVRYRCVVELTPREAAAPAFAPPDWGLSALPKTVEAAYREWTFHGPLFQRVTAIAGIAPGAIIGTIQSPASTSGLDLNGRVEWIADPFVIDAALQLLLIWSRAHLDKTALPARFGSLRRYGPLSDRPMTTYVAVEILAGGHALKSTVHFVDDKGRLRAVLAALEGNCTQALNRLATAGAKGGTS